MLLSARQLSCIRQDRVLFEQLDLQLHAGEVLQIAGKNGAGKSSLLRILAGLVDPEDGEICYQQQPLSHSADDYADNLCFIGHLAGVQPQLTALENLAFWRACFALAPADDWALLAQLGLAGLEDIPCQQLSAGQQRRVSLARLWLTTAQIWILDEPFTALDQGAIAALTRRIAAHCEAGGAVLLTSHQPVEVPGHVVRQLTLEYRW
ncbi:cytochrome c biogenesis heme-transporting ATPase CcmA [Rheinheimera texasensis]|jgi:heme exporter protein A|uniref:cytochrome c biogenesis heme-transporting ATPase CcmA n=1 Tax=Rheinheimera texasensis TaxID=306205 RepID=UPI0004E2846C|nr:cytochrome c biogenesis heme-transporting ATPase CcmA [Rheinheimera texasensis]